MSAPRKDRGDLAGHLALAFVQTCFGLFPIFGKLAFEAGAFTPSSITAWRMLFGAASLLAVAFALHGRAALPKLSDLPILLLGSFLGVTANMALYLEGLSRSTATNAGLMMCLIPVYTFAIAAAAKQERFEASRAAGVLVALLGASMLYWAERPELARAHGVGNLLMALNTLSYAGYLVLTRPLFRRYPPIVLIAWVFALSVPFVPFFMRGEIMVPAAASARAWGSLAFILLFPTSIAYFLNAFALSRLRASTTAMYVYVQPLITGVAGALILGEELSRGVVVSSVLVFAGIWLVARKKVRPEPAPAGA